MEPIFTLPYSEYVAATLLADRFKPSHGCSVFVPASRSEKGVDLLLTKREGNSLRTVSFQIKASRTYFPKTAIRSVKNRRYAFDTWFNRFDVPPQADFFMLIGVYAVETDAKGKRPRSLWESMCLLFSNSEMTEFMSEVRNRNGEPNKMFGFGFDNPDEVFLTRGSEQGEQKCYSSHLLRERYSLIEQMLGGAAA